MTRRLVGILAVTILGLIGPGLSQPAGAQALSLDLFSLLTAATSAPSYTITDLGTLGGSYSVPLGINNAGLVVGNSFTANDAAVHAFLIGGGMVKDLGTLGGRNSGANGINTAGQVAGYSRLAGGQSFHASLWTGGMIRDLGTLGGTLSLASGVNDSGQVCGVAQLSGDSVHHACLWTNGVVKDLGTLDSKPGDKPNSRANAVNTAGQVTGTSGTPDGVTHAFLSTNGQMQDLSSGESAVNSYAYAINAAGHVVGSHDFLPPAITGSEVVNAALWINGKITGLGTLGGENSEANGINAADQVVGYSTTPSDQLGGIAHAFLWSDGVMQDLNRLIPPGSGWFLRSALSINDAGQIVGVGTINGQERAFLLAPAQ